MSKRKTPKSKLKKSLVHIVRKVFSENPESTLNHKQVCALIDIRESALRKLVYNVLEDLLESGYLKKQGHGVYQLSQSESYYEGTLEITMRGAGYVVLDDSESRDVFIAPQNLNHSLSGDRVKVQIIKRGKSKTEGVILDVVERERTQFVGTINMHENFAFLVPDNSRVGADLFIPKEKLKGAKHGEKALAKITVWPKSKDNPFGEVIEVLGSTGGNDTEMISILVNQGLNIPFQMTCFLKQKL